LSGRSPALTIPVYLNVRMQTNASAFESGILHQV
jgi:hypothetical protein